MKSSKNRYEQLQLNFERATEQVDLALKNFSDSAEALLSYEGRRKEARAVEQSTEEMRQRLHRIVGVIAHNQAQRDYRPVWHRVYAKLAQRTGFNALAEAAKKNTKTHLEAVINAGLLPELIEEASSLLMEGDLIKN